MNICPITYKLCDKKYSAEGINLLSPKLTGLNDFPYSAKEQYNEFTNRVGKMSIQGVQPKLSAVLDIKNKTMKLVDKNGKFIIKPQHPHYTYVPENEDLTMRLAQIAGVKVPFHGLIYSKDQSLTYFIKRFDRKARNQKIPVEDFSQLIGKNRETKYDSSMEKVAATINKYCTFPVIEKSKLFRLTLVNYLSGNEDMHLKNFSLITINQIHELSPAYDLVNTTIVTENAKEEIALPIKGKKNKLTKELLIDYFAKERLQISNKIIQKIINQIINAFPQWEEMIKNCFLPEIKKNQYLELINNRRNKLKI